MLDRQYPFTATMAQHPAAPAQGRSVALVAPAAAVLGLGSLIVILTGLGPLSQPMALHIAAMSVLAPLTVYALQRFARWPGWTSGFLWPATLMQLALLWAWHLPLAQQVAISSGAIAVAMATLLAAALCFWVGVAAASPWRAIFALAVTGKLVCLLGALLIFAPRVLCTSPTQDLTLADQQLAGLLMVAGCSLSYLVAAVVLATQAAMRARVPRPPLTAPA